MRPYQGLLTAMVTPFRADGEVNDEAAVALGRHLLQHGSDGLVVAGTTGEGATLSDEEQTELVRLIAGELGSEGSWWPARAPTTRATRSTSPRP